MGLVEEEDRLDGELTLCRPRSSCMWRLRGAFESAQSTCVRTANSLVAKLNNAVLHLVPIPSPHDLRKRYRPVFFQYTEFKPSFFLDPTSLSLVCSLQQSNQEGPNRYALWEHCKTQSNALPSQYYWRGRICIDMFSDSRVNGLTAFTRMVVGVYGTILLLAFLCVQVIYLVYCSCL